MTKIVYGICGVGAGHYIRSRVAIEHLRKKNEVIIIGGLSAYNYFKKLYKNVYWVDGLEFGIKENKITNLTTIIKNLRKISIKNYLNIKRLRKKLDEFKPNLIISDWELFTNLYARDRKIKLINIDNEHFVLYGKIKLDTKYRIDYYKAYLIAKLFKYGETIIIGLPGQKLRNEKEASIINPLLRKEILKLKDGRNNNILVYKSITINNNLIDLLKKVAAKFIVYGESIENIDENITFKKFEEKEFLKDLANCKGVITTGGLTLISEAIYLKKPLLIIPIRNHFEQILNALYIKENNMGLISDNLDQRTLEIFLLNLEKFNKINYKPGNKKLFDILDNEIKKLK